MRLPITKPYFDEEDEEAIFEPLRRGKNNP